MQPTYALDANGNVTDASLQAGSTAYDHSSFAYDSRDNLITDTDANNNHTNYVYDEEGRLKVKTNPDGSTATLSYDSLSGLSQVLLSSGITYNYLYDLEGHLKDAKVTSGGTLTKEYIYTYDAVGNLTGNTEKETIQGVIVVQK